MRRRDDSVFFFTLVDLLLTAIFLGLMLYVFGKEDSLAERARNTKLEKQVADLADAAGVSDIVALTDEFTRLGPVREIKSDLAAVAEVGGRESLRAGFAKLKSREGLDLPPCLVDDNNTDLVLTIARMTASDSTISIREPTPALDEVLKLLGRTYESVQTLSLLDFRRAFGRIKTMKPYCRYTVVLHEATKLTAPRDAVGFVFYHQIRRR